MFYIHPIVQFTAILIAFYVLKLGISRFRFIHLKQDTRFKWKLHVRLGIAATTLWLFGFFGGTIVVKSGWYGYIASGLHAKIGLLMIPFIVFSLASGVYMDRKKKKRTILPLVHAVLNSVMLLLALLQIYTGVGIYLIYTTGL